MTEAIVFTSNTGHTAAYAALLSKSTGLPVYESKAAGKILSDKAEVIYLGWLMAGKLQGYKAAAKRFSVAAVGAVGMSSVEAQRDDIRRINAVPAATPVFCLQGGFEMEKLHGVYRFMMKVMRGSVGKKLAAKQDRTPEEEESLELLMHGKNCVKEENLKEIITWYEETR